VSGNHDCYEEAFGISPRVMGHRANEGIPADNNLTFYEALLAFGRTYGTIKKKFNFKAELLEWFYKVLTPWADFAVKLKNQRVVGLQWGDDECMLRSKGQGFGHLPRADQSVSAGQLSLFVDGLSDECPTVLMTHFTFVSYADSISIVDPAARDVTELAGRQGDLNLRGTFGDHDQGTFELERTAMYSQVSHPEKVQAVFTGHSHRKGLYFLNSRQLSLDVPTTMFNFDRPIAVSELPRGVSDDTPIIVSDCAGPLPRYNRLGEFAGWGSDRPAGTVAYFRGKRLDRVSALRASGSRTKPRVVVALDYLHWLKGEVFQEIATDWFDPQHEADADLGLNIWLKCDVVTLGGVVFHSKAADALPWTRCEAAYDEASNKWVVPAAQRDTFRDWLRFGPSAGRFLSLRFVPNSSHPDYAAMLERYDFSDPWNFEVKVVSDFWPGRKRYFVDNPTGTWDRVPEAPDFAWRERLYST
jgi:hypothetical protein